MGETVVVPLLAVAASVVAATAASEVIDSLSLAVAAVVIGVSVVVGASVVAGASVVSAALVLAAIVADGAAEVASVDVTSSVEAAGVSASTLSVVLGATMLEVLTVVVVVVVVS